MRGKRAFPSAAGAGNAAPQDCIETPPIHSHIINRRMESLAILRDFLGERLAVAPERVQPSATLEELAVDSLMLLELLFEFEDKLGIKLSKDIKTPRTVAELLALVDQLRSARA